MTKHHNCDTVREDPTLYGGRRRLEPGWDTITGDFTLHIFTAADQPPTPEQEAAFTQFNADPAATARLVLSAILDWYQDIRPQWIKDMNGSPEIFASSIPDILAPEGLLEIIELQSVLVMAAPTLEETAGPREFKVPFGAEAGKKIVLPPKKPGVAVVLSFHWEDEHGLGVRWRGGKIEKVGTWESALDE